MCGRRGMLRALPWPPRARTYAGRGDDDSLFANVFGAVILTEAAKPLNPLDRKLAVVALTQLVCDCPPLLEQHGALAYGRAPRRTRTKQWCPARSTRSALTAPRTAPPVRCAPLPLPHATFAAPNS